MLAADMISAASRIESSAFTLCGTVFMTLAQRRRWPAARATRATSLNSGMSGR